MVIAYSLKTEFMLMNCFKKGEKFRASSYEEGGSFGNIPETLYFDDDGGADSSIQPKHLNEDANLIEIKSWIISRIILTKATAMRFQRKVITLRCARS